jgi:DNA polymerase-3 subunit delta'
MENNKLKTELKNLHAKGKFPQSILLYGEGEQKNQLAKYIAQLLCCLSTDKPCGQCKNCNNITENNYPDLIYAEKSGKLGGFSTETVRGLKESAVIKPTSGKNKIYILMDAENITVQAQNALLKLIEEPPNNVFIILTADNPEIFLETIRSRVYKISVGNTDFRHEIPTDLIAAIKSGNEYHSLVLLSKAVDRESVYRLLYGLDIALYDNFSEQKAVFIHDRINTALEGLKGNLSAKLVVTSFCASIFTV